jgi:hypothetical protein
MAFEAELKAYADSANIERTEEEKATVKEAADEIRNLTHEDTHSWLCFLASSEDSSMSSVFLSNDYDWKTSKICGVPKFLDNFHVIFETNAANQARECDYRVPGSLAATAAKVGSFASW